MGSNVFVVRKGKRLLYRGGRWGFMRVVDFLVNPAPLIFEVEKK